MVRIESSGFASWTLSQVCLQLLQQCFSHGWGKYIWGRYLSGCRVRIWRFLVGAVVFFSIFAAIERFVICSNRLLGDSRLQYQQYYLLARAWSLWHHFESFTCVGTRDSASEAGFVHGDSLFCNQDLLISALAKDQKISRWGEVVINLVGEELAEGEPGGGALQVWGLVAPFLHHRLLHLNIRDGVNLMIWFLFWRFTFLGFALTLMQISLGTLMQFGCWINLASNPLIRAAKVRQI